jgi:phosphatidate cytidylyltransferase
MALRLFLKRDPESSISAVSAAVFGLIYLPGLISFQLSIVKTGPSWIILLYTSVWAADSMALYVGKTIGKRKLYPEISPNKTIEGAVGSVLGGIVGAAFIKWTLLSHLTILQAVIIGLAVGFSTIAGDLVESMFKRDAGVKDSSHLLPGHGGVLDKLDGVTFAGPVFYWVCTGLGADSVILRSDALHQTHQCKVFYRVTSSYVYRAK